MSDDSNDTSPSSTLTAAILNAASEHFGLPLELSQDGEITIPFTLGELVDHLQESLLCRAQAKEAGHDPAKMSPEEILEEARLWGVMHGEVLTTEPDIYAAVRAGDAYDWLEDSDMLWDGLGFDLEDLGLPPDLVEAAEDVAREAAKEAAEKLILTMTPEQIEEMFMARHDDDASASE